MLPGCVNADGLIAGGVHSSGCAQRVSLFMLMLLQELAGVHNGVLSSATKVLPTGHDQHACVHFCMPDHISFCDPPAESAVSSLMTA